MILCPAAPSPEVYCKDLRIFNVAPANWVGENFDQYSNAIIAQYTFNNNNAYFIVYEDNAGPKTTMKYGWIKSDYVGDYLKGEWEHYKKVTNKDNNGEARSFEHDRTIDSLRAIANEYVENQLAQPITDGSAIDKLAADREKIRILSTQLNDLMGENVLAIKVRADERTVDAAVIEIDVTEPRAGETDVSFNNY
ncbi:hypothetical protein SLS60_006022 [Paraconiothyrium brasiliense]|uniref:Uncharacterized protein n=1 Tax=Paraconiothyrium brasiliense TaxID=300254 RepID=A0ABR3RDT6_9PLEO